jgi:CO/xanthine dehydrogenase FAD-binding subunit
VKAAAFRYERPRRLEEALELLRDEESRALAGGQSLVPMMAMRLARPAVVVDLAAVPALDGVHRRDGALVTGAMVRQRALERRSGLAGEVPLLAAVLPHIGHREIRNRGTVGGSLAHADPAAELGLVAAVLGAMVVTRSPSGSREIAGSEFGAGPFETALRDGELVTEVRWPIARSGDGFAFAEVARRHGDFALCGVAAWVRPGEVARVGLLGVGPSPVVRELAVDGDVVDAAAEVASELQPADDMHATSSYRRRLARVLLERCLRRAYQDAAA